MRVIPKANPSKSSDSHEGLLPHRRQFVVGPKPFRRRNNWISKPIGARLFLNHCPLVRVQSSQDKNGKSWWLLGNAVSSKRYNTSVLDEVSDTETIGIPEIASEWAGNWLLINDQTVVPDGGALFSCYYSEVAGETGLTEVWLSSSLRLLSEISGSFSETKLRTGYSLGAGIDYDPPPLTRYENVFRLLPSQMLAFDPVRVQPYRLDYFKKDRALSAEQALNLAAEKLRIIASNMHNLPGPSGKLQLALSAGSDSRLIGAALSAMKVRFNTFTLINPPGNSRSDIALPPRISKFLNVPHQYFGPKDMQAKASSFFQEHIAGDYYGVEFRSVPRNLYSEFNSDDVLVRGSGLQPTICFFWWAIEETYDWSDPNAVDTLIHQFGNIPDEKLRRLLKAWFKWMKAMPVPDLDLRDRFCWETRLAGWAASTEHAIAMAPAATFSPLNCLPLNKLLLTVPAAARKEKRHMTGLIERLHPGLLKYPINPPESVWTMGLERAMKFNRILREKGVKSAVKWGSNALARQIGRFQRAA